ncbi:peptidase [Streptomyces sp. NPDC060194]|uniref:peptidase n=1 Tax=Streptomyces sp. NPDC060194 TaxID=3347069 RepID=UPI00365BD690
MQAAQGPRARPHYDSEPDRAPAYARAITSGALPAGWAVDDGAAALFVDGRLQDAVARTPGAAIWRVERRGGTAVRTAASMRLIG